MIRVAGHRGAAGRAPENTCASFRLAWELGADMVELDVRLTADGHPVVLHDPTLDRTTSGTGRVAERTLAEIRALDAGSHFGPAFAGERVPALAEALGVDLSPSPSRAVNPSPSPSPKRGGESEHQGSETTPNAAPVPAWAAQTDATRWLVELKRGEEPPERLVERAVAAIEAAGAAGVVRLISFDETLLAEGLRQAPAIPRGIINGTDPGFLLAVADRLQCVAIHPAGTILTPELVARAHAAGHRVNTWTLNTIDAVREAAGLGVDEITSDFPDVVIGALREIDLR
jgi:glycerophosphoryl diester phosphodiesterase